MKNIIKNEKYGEIVFKENVITGKKRVFINGKELAKVNRTTFKMDDGTSATISGTYFTGCKLKVGEDAINLTPPLKWYEYILSILPLILVLVWGNCVALCQIVPIVGGAVGGLIAAVFCIVNLFVIKKFNKWWVKLLISIVTLALTFLVCFLVALLILNLI